MIPPPSAAEVHGTNDYLPRFLAGKNAKKSHPKLGEEPKKRTFPRKSYMTLFSGLLR
jgi:hypothetical protein